MDDAGFPSLHCVMCEAGTYAVGDGFGGHSVRCWQCPAGSTSGMGAHECDLAGSDSGDTVIVLTLTASGSVSDYSDTSSLQSKYANAAGVDASRVTIVVTAASVIITITITLPAGKTAAAVADKVISTLGSSDIAVSKSLDITVESTPPVTTTEAPTESSDSGLTDGEIAGVAIGASVGGIVLLGVVGLILRSIMFKEAKPVFTCLEKSTAKSPA